VNKIPAIKFRENVTLLLCSPKLFKLISYELNIGASYVYPATCTQGNKRIVEPDMLRIIHGLLRINKCYGTGSMKVTWTNPKCISAIHRQVYLRNHKHENNLRSFLFAQFMNYGTTWYVSTSIMHSILLHKLWMLPYLKHQAILLSLKLSEHYNLSQ
jgi:hypothetical protein